MQDTVIALRDVSKFYRLYTSPQDRLKEALNPFGKTYHKKFYAIRNLNLEIRRGEIIGIIGRNGSGKSTLLKLISGVLTPDEGSAKVRGNISALLELGSGFNPEFTGMQNIFFYGTILGFSREQMRQRLDDIIAFAEIGEFIHQPLKTYSSGMKSRLGFAVAVHIDPEILILDEVLAVGDVLFRRKCHAKMEEFFASGKTIIYVSHDANAVNELCTRAVMLDAGNVILEDIPKTVTAYYQKYLFATGSAQDRIRDEIKALPGNDGGTGSEGPARHKEAQRQAQFIEGFVSTPNRMNEDMVSFEDVMLYTLEGERVNQLSMRAQYDIKFSVHFKTAMRDVSIGLRIKTIQGVVLSGLNLKSTKGKSIESVKCGDLYDIESRFDCLLLPGTYFVNLSCSNGEGDRAGVDDAFMFKVLPESEKQGGYVTLNQTLKVTRSADARQ